MQGHVRKRGKTWSYVFDIGKIDGKRKQKEKGGFKTKKEAEKALRKAIEEWESTGEVFEVTDMLYSEYLDYFIENYIEVNLRENSQRARKHIIKNHIRPAFGQYKIAKLNPASLQKFITDKTKEYSRNYASMIYTTLSLSLKLATEWDFIKINPMTKVKMPKAKEDDLMNKVQTLTLEEVEKIRQLIKGTHHYIPFLIAFHTGARAGEVAALQWSDVNFEDKSISINKRLDYRASTKEWEFLPPKTRTSNRVVTIGNELIKILKSHSIQQKENRMKYGEYYTMNNFICTRENGKMVTTKEIGRMSSIVKKVLGINFNFHMLRHTHATMLLEAGVNPKIVQERLGHSTISITLDTYSHITKDFHEKAISDFENYLQKKIIANEK